MNFTDDVEPWRAGGDNSNAGKPVVRYGPRPQEERDYHKHKAESDYYELLYFLKSRIDKFNNSTDLNERQTLLKEILSRKKLHFKKHGAISIDCPAVKSFSYKGLGIAPMFLLEISDGLVMIKRVLDEKKYSYIPYIPYKIENLTLELRGHCSRCVKKEPQRSKLEVHAILPNENTWVARFILNPMLKFLHIHNK